MQSFSTSHFKFSFYFHYRQNTSFTFRKRVSSVGISVFELPVTRNFLCHILKPLMCQLLLWRFLFYSFSKWVCIHFPLKCMTQNPCQMCSDLIANERDRASTLSHVISDRSLFLKISLCMFRIQVVHNLQQFI